MTRTERNRAWRDRRHRDGICIDCPSPLEDVAKVRCATCRRHYADEQKLRRVYGQKGAA